MTQSLDSADFAIRMEFPRVSGALRVWQSYPMLSKKHQLLRMCARIGFNPPFAKRSFKV